MGWCLIICCLYEGPLGLLSLGQVRGFCLHGRGQQTRGSLPWQEPGRARTPGTWPWLCRDSTCNSRQITAQRLASALHFSRIGSLVVVPALSYQGAVKSRGVCESHVPCGVEWVNLGSCWNPPQQGSGRKSGRNCNGRGQWPSMCPEAWGSLFQGLCSREWCILLPPKKRLYVLLYVKGCERFRHHYTGDRGSREGHGEGEGRLSLDRPHSVRSKVAREEWVCGDGWEGGALFPVCL